MQFRFGLYVAGAADAFVGRLMNKSLALQIGMTIVIHAGFILHVNY